MKAKILRNIFIGVWVPFALVRVLFAATSDGVPSFGDVLLGSHPPTYTSFDVSDAGTGPGQGTLPLAINPGGLIAGEYLDASNVFHGFLRAADGTITTFSAPGAGTSFHEGTAALSINPGG